MTRQQEWLCCRTRHVIQQAETMHSANSILIKGDHNHNVEKKTQMPHTLKFDAGMNTDIRNYLSPRQAAGTENTHPNPTRVTPPAAEAAAQPATATRTVRRRVMFTSSSSDDDVPQSNDIGHVPTPESITTANVEHHAHTAQGAMPQPHMMVANADPPSITLEHDAHDALGAMPQPHTMVANPTPPSIMTATPEHLACAAPNVVTVGSSDSESDDMWVRPRAVQQDHSSQQDHSRLQQVPPQSPIQTVGAAELSRDAVQRRLAAGAAPSPRSSQKLPSSPREHCGRQAQTQRQQPTPAPNRTRAQRRRLEAIASESSGSDDSSDCSESDEDAQQMYRDAIRGVRNARQARNQVRTATQHCVVCATFAKFVANFL